MAEATAPVLELEIELAVVVELAAEVELERRVVLWGSADEIAGGVLAGLEQLGVVLQSPEVRTKTRNP